jgi:RsiW-degrading membrane proteinase PrsW (M82 family)
MDTTCDNCGHTVPARDYCCRCGSPLTIESVAHRSHGRRPDHYAALPDEPAWALRLTSTLFPHLPAHDMATFRIALVSGLGLIVTLGAFGVFPVALVAAAVLIPLLTLLYFYTVDVFEDEPLLVVGLTMLAGAVWGIVLGVVLQHLAVPAQQHGLGELGTSPVILRVVVVPLAVVVLALVGPLVLLRHPRFNDVLDGVIFGAASAVALGSAMTLVTAWPLTQLGLQPHQDTTAWMLRLVELGILAPVISAGAVGWAAGTLWTRYRAPVRDRKAFGTMGVPVVGVVTAIVLLVVAAVLQQVLSPVGRLVALAVLAALILLLVRRAIHVGLLEEQTEEAEPGPEVVCANCGRMTPLHTFCARCGVALRALPKRPSGRGTAAES